MSWPAGWHVLTPWSPWCVSIPSQWQKHPHCFRWWLTLAGQVLQHSSYSVIKPRLVTDTTINLINLIAHRPARNKNHLIIFGWKSILFESEMKWSVANANRKLFHKLSINILIFTRLWHFILNKTWHFLKISQFESWLKFNIKRQWFKANILLHYITRMGGGRK